MRVLTLFDKFEVILNWFRSETLQRSRQKGYCIACSLNFERFGFSSPSNVSETVLILH